MYVVTALVLLTAAEIAQPQCLTPKDNFKEATYSTDLSNITDFGLNLYKKLSPLSSTENFFFSPYSIWNALTLTYFGSRGNTQREMEEAMKFSDKVSTIKLWKELELFYVRRQVNNANYAFSIANRAYINHDLSVRPCLSHILGRELRVADFIQVEQTANSINMYVSEVTRGLIPELVKANDLIAALMVIVNAAYFKGTWESQFDPVDTQPQDFFFSQTQSAPMPMMQQFGRFRYGESSRMGARVLELPYAGGDISMILLLPQERLPFGDRFANMVNNLNTQNLREILHSRRMAQVTVHVMLPKFKFEKELRDELIMALGSFGIQDLFKRKIANLTAFSSPGLYVKKVIHKSFVEVNEEGTEAAAATAVILVPTRSASSGPVLFHCTQPFIFMIYDKRTNNILFMGSIKSPIA